MSQGVQGQMRVIRLARSYLMQGESLQKLGKYLSTFVARGDQIILVHEGCDEAMVSHFYGNSDALDSDEVINHETSRQIWATMERNKALVHALEQRKLSALGVSGVDGSLVTLPEGPQGNGTGNPLHIHNLFLRKLLLLENVLVVAPVGLGHLQEQMLVRADWLAEALAVAVNADVLTFIVDIDKKYNKNGFIARISTDDVRVFHARSLLGVDLPNKLQASLSALKQGVSAVWMGDLHSLSAESHMT